MENTTTIAPNAKNIYKMVVTTKTNDSTLVNAKLTNNPIEMAKEIADGWLASKELEVFDIPIIVEEDDCYSINIVPHLPNKFMGKLVITWEKLTDTEIELVKGMFN